MKLYGWLSNWDLCRDFFGNDGLGLIVKNNDKDKIDFGLIRFVKCSFMWII